MATDGSVITTDSAVGISDASGLDANTSIEDASTITTDAMTLLGDAGGLPGLDGGVQPLAVCIDACDVINTCSGDMGGGDLQDCHNGCTDDLQDCSMKQLSAVDSCVANPPGIQCQALITCFRAIDCIQAL